MNNPRRVNVLSVNIVMLLMPHVLRVWIRLAGVMGAPRGQPGNYICHFLVGHGPARQILAPVRRAQFRPPCDHSRSKMLVTHYRLICPIYNRTGLLSSCPIGAVTRGAERLIHFGAALQVARSFRCIGWRGSAAEKTSLGPEPDSANQDIDLFVGEHSASALREGGHRRVTYSAGCDAANRGIVSDRE